MVVVQYICVYSSRCVLYCSIYVLAHFSTIILNHSPVNIDPKSTKHRAPGKKDFFFHLAKTYIFPVFSHQKKYGSEQQYILLVSSGLQSYSMCIEEVSLTKS